MRTLSIILVLAAALATAVSAGCSQHLPDYCQAGDAPRCEGAVATSCTSGPDPAASSYDTASESPPREVLAWSRTDCADAALCRLGRSNSGAFAYCTLAPSPDPRCAGPHASAVCDGHFAVKCQDGYATEVRDCGACAELQVPSFEELQLAVGATVNLTVSRRSVCDGAVDDATSLVTWSSGDVAVATVDSNGLVRGKSPGVSQITAHLDGAGEVFFNAQVQSP